MKLIYICKLIKSILIVVLLFSFPYTMFAQITAKFKLSVIPDFESILINKEIKILIVLQDLNSKPIVANRNYEIDVEIHDPSKKIEKRKIVIKEKNTSEQISFIVNKVGQWKILAKCKDLLPGGAIINVLERIPDQTSTKEGNTDHLSNLLPGSAASKEEHQIIYNLKLELWPPLKYLIANGIHNTSIIAEIDHNTKKVILIPFHSDKGYFLDPETKEKADDLKIPVGAKTGSLKFLSTDTGTAKIQNYRTIYTITKENKRVPLGDIGNQITLKLKCKNTRFIKIK